MHREIDSQNPNARQGVKPVLAFLILLGGTLALLTAGCAMPAAHTPAYSTDAALSAGTATVDPTAPYFERSHVLSVSINMDPEDFQTLRAQTRTWEELMEEIGTGCLESPFEGIFSWFPALVTVDGESLDDVGVRKKGFMGSLSYDRPSLKLRFDKYVDDQLLGGAIERMTLNNSLQDKSKINTCLAYEVFAAAGLPAPRCNFATVEVNGQNLGLYVHVEEIKEPFLARHFENADGNLYEGTVSDFRPGWSGSFEKKTNEDAQDWTDIAAVTAALQTPGPEGLQALDEIVDVDRFLTYWALESLLAHWDGYTGNRNNNYFYREPGDRFVFIPWGVDQTFLLSEDPNPFDDIRNPPPSVFAHGAIAHRLYADEESRRAYVTRLRSLLGTVWNEPALLASMEELAAVVGDHATGAARIAAARDTERVRTFIQGRRAAIMADLDSGPPEWNWGLTPPPCAGLPDGRTEKSAAQGVSLEIRAATVWGSNEHPDPLSQGDFELLMLDGQEPPPLPSAVLAGAAEKDIAAMFGFKAAVDISVFFVERNGGVEGVTFIFPQDLARQGAALSVAEGQVRGGAWQIPPGGSDPQNFVPLSDGELQLLEFGSTADAAVRFEFRGSFGSGEEAEEAGRTEGTGASDAGLVINEVNAQGDPLDWFELHNTSDADINLSEFVVADDLEDEGKRVAFPDGLFLPAGGYLQIELDKDGWPGYALGKDEELGIWTADGVLVASVDWDSGQSEDGTSLARVPDGQGDFQTVETPTPGAANVKE